VFNKLIGGGMRKILTGIKLVPTLLLSGVIMLAFPNNVYADGGSSNSEFTYTLSTHVFVVGSNTAETVTIYNNTDDDFTSVWIAIGGGKYSAGPPSSFTAGASPSGATYYTTNNYVDYEDSIVVPAHGSAQVTVYMSSDYAYDEGSDTCIDSDDYSQLQVSVGNADWSTEWDAPIECGVFSAVEQ
jgi:hypothetical protein